MKSQWLNNTKIIKPEIEKPCAKLKYCPYGQLVEEYQFSRNKLSCLEENGSIINFGHDCPVHYLVELLK